MHRKGFIYSYLTCNEGGGEWPRMGSTVELERCLELTRETASLQDLRSWINAGQAPIPTWFYYFSNAFFCGDALSVFF
jgi:hypothetical protein